eukprot:12359488-Alexandrium_andersonii.AAC.1
MACGEEHTFLSGAERDLAAIGRVAHELEISEGLGKHRGRRRRAAPREGPLGEAEACGELGGAEGSAAVRLAAGGLGAAASHGLIQRGVGQRALSLNQ